MNSHQPNKPILLRNARTVLPDRVVENSAVLIEAGRIERMFDGNAYRLDNAELYDLAGLTLYPGMIDLHIHGAVRVDTMSASTAELNQVAQFLSAHAVTGWLPTLVPAAAAEYEKAIDVIGALMTEQSSGRVPHAARVLGVHYEGPFVNSAQCGALHSQHFRSFSSAADIETLPVPNIPNAVRMMTLAPEVDGGIELIGELVGKGWVVSIGHTRARIEDLEHAFAAGARHMTHFMNAMPALHHRAPGPVGWGLIKKEVTFDVIADGVHIDPLILQLLLRTKGAAGVMLISDAIAAAGAGDGDYEIWGETISVKNGRTSNVRGSIAGSVITMLEAARTMRSLGASEVEVARMASTNPARLLGIGHDCGSIETGKRADLVAIDQDGKVKLTIIGGEVVFQA